MPGSYPFPPREQRDDPFAEIQMVFDKLRGHFASRGPSRINPWLIALIVLLVYAATGIFIVAPDERGIVLRFGRVVREADPGPGYHLPWPFEEVLKPPVTQILKEEFPNTRRAAWETVWLPHPVLLGTRQDTTKVVEAIRKIQNHAKELL